MCNIFSLSLLLCYKISSQPVPSPVDKDPSLEPDDRGTEDSTHRTSDVDMPTSTDVATPTSAEGEVAEMEEMEETPSLVSDPISGMEVHSS